MHKKLYLFEIFVRLLCKLVVVSSFGYFVFKREIFSTIGGKRRFMQKFQLGVKFGKNSIEFVILFVCGRDLFIFVF